MACQSASSYVRYAGFSRWCWLWNNTNLTRVIGLEISNLTIYMAKTLLKKVKVQAIGGKATPAPPLGPVLGQAGINIGEFVNQFNEKTQERIGEVVPVEINVYDDRSFDFIVKTSPASRLLLKKAGKDKASGKNLVSKGGEVTMADIRAIAEEKMPDLNTTDIEAAMKTVMGTAYSMGIHIKDRT